LNSGEYCLRVALPDLLFLVMGHLGCVMYSLNRVSAVGGQDQTLRVTTSLSLRFAALVVVGLGVFTTWVSYQLESVSQAAFATAYFVTGTGLGLGASWSRWILYVLTIVGIVGWSYGVWAAYAAGWPYDDLLRTVISLIPGVALIAIHLACVWVAYKQLGVHPSDA
jgi:hypothetical protein